MTVHFLIRVSVTLNYLINMESWRESKIKKGSDADDANSVKVSVHVSMSLLMNTNRKFH